MSNLFRAAQLGHFAEPPEAQALQAVAAGDLTDVRQQLREMVRDY